MDSTINLILILALYFLPTIMAATGRRGSVFVLNLFLGWTLLGWVAALFMALRSREAAKAGA